MALNPIDPILQPIKDNPSSFIRLELKGPLITDEVINEVVKIFPKDSHICEISIKSHCLTNNSYPLLLKLLRDHPKITSFYCGSVEPLDVKNGAVFNRICINLVERHKAAAKAAAVVEAVAKVANQQKLSDKMPGHFSQADDKKNKHESEILLFTAKKSDPPLRPVPAPVKSPVHLSEFPVPDDSEEQSEAMEQVRRLRRTRPFQSSIEVV